MKTPPNYSLYTLDELQDVLESIDKAAYPERYDSVVNELRVRNTDSERPETTLEQQNSGDQAENILPHWQQPKTHFPKLGFGAPAAVSVSLVVIFTLILNKLVNLGVVYSLILAVFSVLACASILVAVRQKEYFRFLDTFGIAVTSMEFLKAPSVRALVPYRNYNYMCSVRVEGEQLLFGKPKHYRKLSFSLIESFELRQHYGHVVAKVNFLDDTSAVQNELFIPWDDSIKEAAESPLSEHETAYAK